MTAIVLLAHAAVTLAMTGVIWFVQVVHYPLFPFAAGPDFARFAAAHQQRTSVVVAPLMLIELATASWLLLPAAAVAALPAWIGWLLLVAIWLSTALVQVPLHRGLAHGFDAAVARRLVRGNWARTWAWSARAAIALWLLSPGARAAQAGGPPW